MMTGSGAKIAGGVEQPARVKAVQVAASAVSDFFMLLPEVVTSVSEEENRCKDSTTNSTGDRHDRKQVLLSTRTKRRVV